MNVYLFEPKKYPLLNLGSINKIIKARKNKESKALCSLDLGISFEEIYFEDSQVRLRDSIVSIDLLEEIAEKNEETDIYAVIKNNIFPLKFYSNAYYKLRNLGETAPTLEINGIHMHRIKDITPWEDARIKVETLGVTIKDKVLDICTGLGYTAIHCLEKNVKKIVSIEKDVNVLKIAEYNSWSSKLSKVKIILGDALQVLDELEKGYFNKIVHDPPTYAVAEDLYSFEFYKKLYDILPSKGKVFHYIGYPKEVSGSKNIKAGIIKRCKSVGFRILGEINYGLLLEK